MRLAYRRRGPRIRGILALGTCAVVLGAAVLLIAAVAALIAVVAVVAIVAVAGAALILAAPALRRVLIAFERWLAPSRASRVVGDRSSTPRSGEHVLVTRRSSLPRR